LKIKLLLIIMGMAVVVVYGILAILLVGVPGRSASPGGLTAKDAYPLALEKAQTWQTDAQLVSATASWRDLTAEQLLEEDASWGFTFFSPQSRQIKIISVTEAGAQGVESINVPPTLRVLDVTSWQVDSPQVLGLFLDRGGRDFLAQHPEATVSLRLGLEEGGEGLVWLAFGIDNTDRSTMTLQIDGNSGNVMSPTP
jgi:hypothetical protein